MVIRQANLKRNFMWQSATQILSMILPLVTSPILSRALGVEGVGIYAYVTAVQGYFIMAANLGIYKYGLREIAKVRDDEHELSRVFWEIWWIHAILSATVAIAYLVFAFMFVSYRTYFLICFMGFLANVFNLNWLFSGVEDIRRIAIRDITTKVVSFVLVVLLVRDESDLGIYFIIMQTSALVAGAIYWFGAPQYIHWEHASWRGMMAHYRGLMILSVPVAIESIYTSIGRVLLGTMADQSQVGYFDNADKALIARTIIWSLTTVLMPRMASVLNKKDTGQFDRLMGKAVNIIMVLACAFGFGTAAVGDTFAVLFWGSEFEPSGVLISIMALAMPGMALARVVREQYLIPLSRNREYLVATLIGTVANIVMNIALIPFLGARGSAIAVFCTEYMICIVQIVLTRNELDMKRYLHRTGVYPIFGMIMFGIVKLVACLPIELWVSLLVQIGVGAFVYGGSCIIYWKYTKQTQYFDLCSSFFRRFLR